MLTLGPLSLAFFVPPASEVVVPPAAIDDLAVEVVAGVPTLTWTPAEAATSQRIERRRTA